MSKRLVTWILVVLSATPACRKSSPVPAGVHAPFVALSYEAALAQAHAQDRVVMIDFTATWCPPCRAMEESTWPNAEVQAWIERNAIAIQADVDEQGKLASAMDVTGIPAIVFLDAKGTELGRFTGYRNPTEFLAAAAKFVH